MRYSCVLSRLFLAAIAMPMATAQAEAFVEASTKIQKIGLEIDDLRPFLVGSIWYYSTPDESITSYSLGGGLDWTRPVQEIELGFRGFGLFSANTGSSLKSYSGAVELIAKKKFGALTVGGGIGPSFSTYEFGSDDIYEIGLGNELFVSLNF